MDSGDQQQVPLADLAADLARRCAASPAAG
jgi:hypothetical protein